MVIAGAPSVDKDFYATFVRDPRVGFVLNRTYDRWGLSTAALVTSGTATLETALYQVPQVVCYRANWISYQIAKRIITLDFISLVNLIMGKEVVKELIQDDLNAPNLKGELAKILSGPARKAQLENYAKLSEKLGGKGASDQTAELIIEDIARA